MRFAFNDNYLPEFAHFERLGHMRRSQPGRRGALDAFDTKQSTGKVHVVGPDKITWIGRLRTAWTNYKRAFAYRRDIDQLRDLPDYALRDLGLTRREIKHAVLFGVTDHRRPPLDPVGAITISSLRADKG